MTMPGFMMVSRSCIYGRCCAFTHAGWRTSRTSENPLPTLREKIWQPLYQSHGEGISDVNKIITLCHLKGKVYKWTLRLDLCPIDPRSWTRLEMTGQNKCCCAVVCARTEITARDKSSEKHQPQHKTSRKDNCMACRLR
jgi:hypothetical protein